MKKLLLIGALTAYSPGAGHATEPGLFPRQVVRENRNQWAARSARRGPELRSVPGLHQRPAEVVVRQDPWNAGNWGVRDDHSRIQPALPLSRILDEILRLRQLTGRAAGMAALAQDAERVAAVRRFNRFYTQHIGVLQDGWLDSPYSLTEARVLYEMQQRGQRDATSAGR